MRPRNADGRGCDVFKGMEHKKKWETAKKRGLYNRYLRKGYLGDSCVRAESVELTDARTDTTRYFIKRK